MKSSPALRLRPAPAPLSERSTRAELVALTGLLAVLLALRVLYVPRIAFDSDEAQHLHVAAEWTRGRVQYRDTFDNHAPLFHLLSAPFVALVGERGDVQLLARYAMFPTFAAMLIATGLLGRRLFGARVGGWAVVLLGFHLEFFRTSLQFRTDDLWVPLWLLTVLLMLDAASLGRRFVAGLCLGLAFSVSLKTSLLVASLAAAALVAGWVVARPRDEPSLRRRLAELAAVAGGAVLVPGALVATFASLGAFEPMVACTLKHSAFSLGDGGWRPWAPLFLILALGGQVALGRLLVGTGVAPGDRREQLTVLWASGFAAAALLTVWPTSTAQDGMALLPGAALAVAVVLTRATDRLQGALARPGARAVAAAALPILVAAGFTIRLLATHPPSLEPTAAFVRDLDRVLSLTDREEPVMDAKGEAIYRRRPFYYVLELFTKRRMRAGLIPDDIVERCVKTSTGVVFGSLGHFSPRARRFFEEHYLGTGRVRVAGGFLSPAARETPVAFEVAIPGGYALVGPREPVRGRLDGTPYAGPRRLDVGPHTFVAGSGSTEVAFAWARAVERGFHPFEEGGPSR